MHEMGIASSVIEAVCDEAKKYPGSHVVTVAMRIGELSGVDGDSFTFCFEALTRDTELERTKIEIERTPRDELEIAYLELEE